MERFWNIIYYFIYLFDCNLHILFTKASPIMFIYKLPFAKKHFKKKGYDPEELVNRMWTDPEIGIGGAFVTGAITGLILLVCFAIYNYYVTFTHQAYNFTPYPFFISCAITFGFNYFILYRDKKYHKYFKEFNKKSRKWKIKWAIISFVTILGMLFLVISSFIVPRYIE